MIFIPEILSDRRVLIWLFFSLTNWKYLVLYFWYNHTNPIDIGINNTTIDARNAFNRNITNTIPIITTILVKITEITWINISCIPSVSLVTRLTILPIGV